MAGALLLLASCAAIEFQTGRQFNPARLEQSLRIGTSTSSDVEAVLGHPYGKGRAMMPFHDASRTVWNYYYERGSVDPGSGKVLDSRQHLYVFLLNDRYDGYMWFESDLR